jgi:hypothetical protein
LSFPLVESEDGHPGTEVKKRIDDNVYRSWKDVVVVREGPNIVRPGVVQATCEVLGETGVLGPREDAERNIGALVLRGSRL